MTAVLGTEVCKTLLLCVNSHSVSITKNFFTELKRKPNSTNGENMNIGYLFKRVKNMSFSQIPVFVKRSKESSGKCTAAVYADMLVCALKYGAGYIDYTIFGMHSMNSSERKQLITR